MLACSCMLIRSADTRIRWNNKHLIFPDLRSTNKQCRQSLTSTPVSSPYNPTLSYCSMFVVRNKPESTPETYFSSEASNRVAICKVFFDIMCIEPKFCAILTLRFFAVWTNVLLSRFNNSHIVFQTPAWVRGITPTMAPVEQIPLQPASLSSL